MMRLRYFALGLFLAVAACEAPKVAPPVENGLRVVQPKEVVMIGGCEYYVFGNNHGDTYAPKMTPQTTIGDQMPTAGYNRCIGQK